MAYTFNVSVMLENPANQRQVVSIPRGTIFESSSTHLSYQSAVIARDYLFRLNPKEQRSVLLEAECWNRHLSPPNNVPGKLTPLKADIKKANDVWKVSSSPASQTVLTNPSRNGQVFSALADAAPARALEFLETACRQCPNSQGVLSGIAGIATPPSGADVSRLCRLGEDPVVHPFLTGQSLRAYFLKTGGPTEQNIEDVVRFVTAAKILTTDRLVSNLYDLAVELSELRDAMRTAVSAAQISEPRELARKKFLDILDALPRLDDVAWTS